MGVDWGVEYHKLDPADIEGQEMPH
jgi:hypothetical protein